jgi:UrcA family protein
MTNLTARISGVAMLALAALPIASLPASALAETRVKVADLSLASAEGMATFQKRAHYAASSYCGDVRGLYAMAACRKGVQTELNDKVAVVRAAQLEQAKTFAAR